MLNLKSSKIQALGWLFAVSLQIVGSTAALAEEKTDSSTAKTTIQENPRLAMNNVAVTRATVEEATPVIDPALERKLKKEMSSYVADMSISVF